MSEYDTDIVRWSEHQAELLRRLAAGERVNDQVDWENVIDEVETVGRSELDAVASALELAMRHKLKVTAWPAAQELQHWQVEIRLHLIRLARRYRPSMRQGIEVEVEFMTARAGLLESLDGVPAMDLPRACPWTLEELLAEGRVLIAGMTAGAGDA